MAGRSYCAECAERFRAHNKKYRETGGAARQSAHKKQLTAQRRAAGLCTRCGVSIPASSHYVECDRCRAKARNAARKVTEQRTGFRTGEARQRWKYGLCWKCGSPLRAGTNAAGEPARTCESCYADTLRAQKKATAASHAGKEAHPWIRDNVISFANSEKSSRRSP